MFVTKATRVALLLAVTLGAWGCASSSASRPAREAGAWSQPRATPPSRATERPPRASAHEAARVAERMIGAPYRYGGSTPSGFDCSGLVVYSYAQAGVRPLPRTAASLQAKARPVALSELRPGDLLFFRLSGRKTSHVGVYVGGRNFVHAPSPGRRVERVSFDHDYWAPRIASAGRLVP